MDTWISIGEKKEIEWRNHKKNCEIFCKICEEGIWSNWILTKMHEDHELISIEEAFIEIWDKVEKAIDKDNSVSRLKKLKTVQLNNWKEIGKNLIENKIKEFQLKIEEISSELIVKYNEKIDEFSKKINKNMDNWLKLEETLSELKNSKDKLIWIEMNENLNENYIYKQETVDWIQEIKESIAEDLNFDFENIYEGVFVIDIEKLTKHSSDLESAIVLDPCTVFFKLEYKDNEKWSLWVKYDDKIKKMYSIIFRLDPDNVLQFTQKCNIHSIQSDSNFNEIGEITWPNDIINQHKNIEYRFILWFTEDDIKNNLKEAKKIIVNELQKFIEDKI